MALLAVLSRRFPGPAHVGSVGLADASGSEVWEYAKTNGFTICSKDTDFPQMSCLYGSPPKVVWLDVGDRGTDEIASLIHTESQVLARFDSSKESLLVVSMRASGR